MEQAIQPSLQSQLDAQKAASAAPVTATIDVLVAALVASGIQERSLKVGDHAPDFTLPDALGRPVSLAGVRAMGPVVITFYRGEWCPFCNLTLHAYQAILPKITALGATLIAISPQTPDHSLSMAEKHSLEFAVLSDVGNVVARQFGLAYHYDAATRAFFEQRGFNLAQFNGDASWELPVPATYLLSSDGTIRLAFVDPDYRHRLEPTDLLAGLRGMKGAQG
ncbi:MAG TPA: peroxiredoxin-like family protein [Ktedonobacterales bacterium]|nr:peroxiredoxin-like family protein [Ktedonobacterales bacterium]